MPNYKCRSCGNKVYLDPGVTGETSCPECGEQFEVSREGRGLEVKAIRPYFPENDLTEQGKELLGPVEVRSLEESSICAGYGAYVSAEFMATRALEGFSCRLTGERKWENAITKLEVDFPHLSGAITYLRDERNKVAHADKELSTESQARQTYNMVIRVINVISEES